MPKPFEMLRLQIARYRWLRDYYALHHLRVNLPGVRFRDAQGATVGYLETATIHQGRLHLRGWALADEVVVRQGDTVLRRHPREDRADVAAAFGCDPQVGFRLSLPAFTTPLQIELLRQGRPPVALRYSVAHLRARLRAQLRLRLRFWREVAPLVPMVARSLARRDPDLNRRIKVALRLGEAGTEAMLDPAFLASTEPVAPASTASGVVVILPVHNAFDLLPEALERVVAHTDLPWRLLLVEDASIDPRVRPWLRDWVRAQAGRAAGGIELIENAENLGFIGSVNRAFERVGPGQDPVVLLNSDAMVPAGWASRLTAPLADPAVASATPLSNDAEIFTAPAICTRTPLAKGQVDRIDHALRTRVAPSGPRVAAPTGVGFCMAMGRDWLQRVGGFDPVFGRGYGEEVDWCRRAAALGARHVAVPDLFVEHRGGASFQGEKLALVQANNAIIARRYPGYDRSVQEFIRADPLVTPRMIAALAWAESRPGAGEIPVYVAHSLGGGAESYLQDRLRGHDVSVVLRLGGAHRCRIELDTPTGRVVASTDDLDFVARLLAPVARRRIVYSCAVGDPDLAAIPALLLGLAADAPLEILFHDYLPLSPAYTLLDADGVYRGVPAADHADSAHVYRRPDGTHLSLAAWRESWGRVIAAAERLVVFSEASADIVATAFPAAHARLAVEPHRLQHRLPRLSPPLAGRPVIGVLGAIGPQKGAAVLAALSRRLARDRTMGLALIGRVAPGFELSRRTAVHGPYAVEDIPALVSRYRITHWLIPSVWPETFSYTVHECLATGLPTLAFDLGAQGAAVCRAPNGVLLPWTPQNRTPEALAESVIAAVRSRAAD